MNKFFCTALGLSLGVMAQSQTISSEDFENGIPSGWSQTTLATDGGWIAGNNGSLSSQSFAIPVHSNMLATNDDGCNCDKSLDIIETSSYDLSSYTGETVRINMDVLFLLGTYQGATESLDLMVSANGGSWNSIHTFSGSTEWQEATFIDISTYAGGSDVKFAFNYNDGAGWTYGAAIDNFTIEIPNEHDIKLTSVKVPPYSTTDVPQIITGVITNLGGSAESAISVTWTDGANTNTTNLAGTLSPGQSMTFEHPDGISLASGTSITVDVEVGISGDVNLTNNELTGYTAEGAAFWPNKVVVGEEATGTWCGWCPRGMAGMEYMEEEHGEAWVGIAVHNNDPMANEDYDSWMGSQISGYPSGLVNRVEDINPSSAGLEAAFEEEILKFGVAGIEVLSLINEDDEVEVRIEFGFAVDHDDNVRVAVVLAEDGLEGSGQDWAQANYYSGGGAGALSGAGVDWHTEGSSVSGLTYDDVARQSITDLEGEDDIISAPFDQGDIKRVVMDKFNWNNDYDKENTRVIVMLIDDDSDEIINAAESHLKDLVLIEENDGTYYIIDGDTFQVWDDDDLVPTGIAAPSNGVDVKAYPNPSQGIINVALSEEAEVLLIDMMGKVVARANYVGNANGIQFNSDYLSAGVYNVVVNTENASVTERVTVIK